MSNLEISRAQRLDNYVIDCFPSLSRNAASKLIEDGKVSVNDTVFTKPGHKIKTEDIIKIDYDVSQAPELPTIDLPVIFENKDCIVINKPAGLLTHSKGAFNYEATVASWLASRLKGMNGERAGIVHRLDRATSGVMICAKTPEAAVWIQKQFSLRKVKKTYEAIIVGQLAHPEAIIDMPIERNPKKPQTFRVSSNGKPAVTAYKTIRATDKLSLLELEPTTGRTHQLRVHLSNLGHPILGDSFYGGKTAARLYLHAEKLELTLPNKERRIFEAKLPKEFSEIMDED